MARSLSPISRRHWANTNVTRVRALSFLPNSGKASSKCLAAASYSSCKILYWARTIQVCAFASSDASRTLSALVRAFFALISSPVRMCVRPNHENAHASASAPSTVRTR